MGEPLTTESFMSIKMIKFFITVVLFVAIVDCGTEQRSGIISHEAGNDSSSVKRNDLTTRLKKSSENTGPESNFTRQSSQDHPTTCGSYGYEPTLEIKRATIEAFDFYSDTYSAINHAMWAGNTGARVVIAFSSGWTMVGYEGVIHCVNYIGYDIIFIFGSKWQRKPKHEDMIEELQ